MNSVSGFEVDKYGKTDIISNGFNIPSKKINNDESSSDLKIVLFGKGLNEGAKNGEINNLIDGFGCERNHIPRTRFSVF